VGVAPRVGVDVDAVAMLGEAFDESAGTSGAGEDGSPLLESQVGRDDDAALESAVPIGTGGTNPSLPDIGGPLEP